MMFQAFLQNSKKNDFSILHEVVLPNKGKDIPFLKYNLESVGCVYMCGPSDGCWEDKQ